MASQLTPSDRQFEEYLRDGVTAVKTGNLKLAENLLNRALILNKHDARPYIWLSATTSNSKEQIEYLEQAVAVDPSNATARRGLAMMVGKIDKDRLAQPGPPLGRPPSRRRGSPR